MFQLKEQEKTPEKTTNETEINNSPDKELKALAIKILTELGKRIDEHSENFNKELENILRNQSELNNFIIEMKNTQGGISNRLGDTEECISDRKIE